MFQASESKISSTYHTKPFLVFGGDGKNKAKMPVFNKSDERNILDRFEEDKKKSKEKCERYEYWLFFSVNKSV